MSDVAADDLSGIPPIPDPLSPPIATQRVIPWEELGAKLVPETYLRITPELIPTLAALMAQGPTAPVLLQTDALRRLQVAADLNPIQTLSAAAIVGAASLQVAKPSAFRVGQTIRILPVDAQGALSGTGEYHTVKSIGASTIGIDPVMAKAAGVGSLVYATSAVQISTPDRLLGSFLVGANGDVSNTYPIDPDVQCIRILLDQPSNVGVLQVSGAFTTYVNLSGARTRTDNVYRYPSALENSATVRVTTGVAVSCNVRVLAVYDVQTVAAEVRSGDVLSVFLTDQFGSGVAQQVDPTDRDVRRLGRVTLDQGAQLGNVPMIVTMNANVLANTVLALLSATTGGHRYWILDYAFDLDGANSTAGVGGLVMGFRSPAGTLLVPMSTAQAQHRHDSPRGIPCPVNSALEFYNGCGATITVRGWIAVVDLA